jgi:glycine cleavage system transcriptional repressor
MKRLFAVAVMGRDRPGIVADVSGRLLGLGCNIEDVVTSQLSGHFALMLVCAAPVEASTDTMRTGMAGLGTDLHVAVWDVDERPTPPRATHVVTVYGPDQTGIVHRVATVLAGHGVNITDMTCRLSPSRTSLYAVTLEIELPEAIPPDALDAALRAAVGPLGLELTLGPIQAEVL